MSILQHCARRSLLPSSTAFSRCPRLFSSLTRPPSRVILIKNFPATSTIDDFLSLRGTGKPIESVIRRKDELQIHYLESDGVKSVRHFSNRDQLVLPDGQVLTTEILHTHRLPVEIIAAIGLRGASRTIAIRDLRGHSKEVLEQGMERRFGKVERIWVHEDGTHGIVTFSHIRAAMKAQKTLLEEGWPVNFRPNLPRPERIRLRDSGRPHYAVRLEGIPVGSGARDILRDLKDILRFQNGDPMRVHTLRDMADLFFSDPTHAEHFRKFYQPPPGVIAAWSPKDRPPAETDVAAIKLGACRTILIDGFVDPGVTFDRLHRDFSKFGEIFYVYLDPKKAHARIVYTNIASSFKAIDDIYQDRAKYDIYHGARVTFGHIRKNKKELSHLRPIFIGHGGASSKSRADETGVPSETNVTEDHIEAPSRAGDDYDDWQDINSSPLSGRVQWTAHQDEVTGRYRLDLSPKTRYHDQPGPVPTLV
ncbi:hypothetical protein D9758_009206 [Tetrapyrgos nigripes]|uniref:RRM domain-containing protein n=1 Tax=Tetrapyrgos nigripes TaxID=182062 RepID=A0A8H5D1X2_9AGAR|nr:hypothetical protein D9758_009206 [Tetrapyrgos nigripes]